MPKDVSREGADESCEQCRKERVIASPPLDHLSRRWLFQQQAGQQFIVVLPRQGLQFGMTYHLYNPPGCVTTKPGRVMQPGGYLRDY